MGITHTLWYNRLVRRIYNGLPLPWHVKQRLKQIYLRRPDAWKANNKELFRPVGNREALVQVATGAKQFDPAQPWVLVIDSGIPLPDENSGKARISALLRLLQEISFRATFVSDSGAFPHLGQQLLKQEEGISVIHGFDATRQHLAEAGGKYHYVLMLWAEGAFKYLPYVRAYALHSKVIYDMTGLRWVEPGREIQVSANQDPKHVFSPDRRVELFNVACADLVLTATNEEKNQLLSAAPNIEVAVLPNILEIFPPRISFARQSVDGVSANYQTARKVE